MSRPIADRAYSLHPLIVRPRFVTQVVVPEAAKQVDTVVQLTPWSLKDAPGCAVSDFKLIAQPFSFWKWLTDLFIRLFTSQKKPEPALRDQVLREQMFLRIEEHLSKPSADYDESLLRKLMIEMLEQEFPSGDFLRNPAMRENLLTCSREEFGKAFKPTAEIMQVYNWCRSFFNDYHNPILSRQAAAEEVESVAGALPNADEVKGRLRVLIQNKIKERMEKHQARFPGVAKWLAFNQLFGAEATQRDQKMKELLVQSILPLYGVLNEIPAERLGQLLNVLHELYEEEFEEQHQKVSRAAGEYLEELEQAAVIEVRTAVEHAFKEAARLDQSPAIRDLEKWSGERVEQAVCELCRQYPELNAESLLDLLQKPHTWIIEMLSTQEGDGYDTCLKFLASAHVFDLLDERIEDGFKATTLLANRFSELMEASKNQPLLEIERKYNALAQMRREQEALSDQIFTSLQAGLTAYGAELGLDNCGQYLKSDLSCKVDEWIEKLQSDVHEEVEQLQEIQEAKVEETMESFVKEWIDRRVEQKLRNYRKLPEQCALQTVLSDCFHSGGNGELTDSMKGKLRAEAVKLAALLRKQEPALLQSVQRAWLNPEKLIQMANEQLQVRLMEVSQQVEEIAVEQTDAYIQDLELKGTLQKQLEQQIIYKFGSIDAAEGVLLHPGEELSVSSVNELVASFREGVLHPHIDELADLIPEAKEKLKQFYSEAYLSMFIKRSIAKVVITQLSRHIVNGNKVRAGLVGEIAKQTVLDVPGLNYNLSEDTATETAALKASLDRQDQRISSLTERMRAMQAIKEGFDEEQNPSDLPLDG